MQIKSFLLQTLKFLLFLGVGLGILYLVYRSQSAAFQEDCALRGIPAEDCSLIGKVIADFRSANYLWIVLVILAFTVSNISRAIRWNMLLRPLGYSPRLINAFLCTVLGYFANLGLPRLGEVVRAGTMAQYEKIPLEKTMATIVLDRLVDAISILSATALALFLQYDTIIAFAMEYVDLSSRFGGLGSVLLWAVLVLAVFLLLFLAFRKRILRTALYGRIRELAAGFRDGLVSISKIDRPLLFILHSVNIWLMYFLMTWLCFFAFEPTSGLTAVVALVVFVFGGWGIVIPSPGGMGTYHFLVQTALQMYGINGDDAFSWANIAFFSLQVGGNVILGTAALVLLPLINRHYEPLPVRAA